MNGEGFPWFLGIFGLVFVIVVIAMIVGFFEERKRREALAALAARLGLEFSRGRLRKFDRRYPNYGFLRKGSNRYAENVIHGQMGEFGVETFDYHYETYSTDAEGNTSTDHHRFSVLLLEAPFPLARLAIRPEGLLDKVSAAFGWDDINFESAEFSRKFHVSADDRRWAYDVLHPRTIDHLLRSPRHPISLHGRHLVVKTRDRLDAAELGRVLETGYHLLDGIPDFARQA